MKNLILLLTFILFSSALTAQELRRLMTEANECVVKHLDAQAERLFKKAIKVTQPTDIDLYLVYLNLGAVQQRMDKKTDALDAYDSALLLKPTSLNALNNRGVLKMELKDFSGAMADFNAAIRVDSLKEDAYINRSFLYKLLKDTAAASKDLKRALQIKPYNTAARNSYAGILMHQGKYDEALNMYIALVEEFPNQSIMLNNMAEIYTRMKKYGQAISYANKAITLNPEFDAAYIVRAQIYLATDDSKAAKKDLKKALSIGAKDANVQILLDRCK